MSIFEYILNKDCNLGIQEQSLCKGVFFYEWIASFYCKHRGWVWHLKFFRWFSYSVRIPSEKRVTWQHVLSSDQFYILNTWIDYRVTSLKGKRDASPEEFSHKLRKLFSFTFQSRLSLSAWLNGGSVRFEWVCVSTAQLFIATARTNDTPSTYIDASLT